MARAERLSRFYSDLPLLTEFSEVTKVERFTQVNTVAAAAVGFKERAARLA